jgi:hypothetical protein
VGVKGRKVNKGKNIKEGRKDGWKEGRKRKGRKLKDE